MPDIKNICLLLMAVACGGTGMAQANDELVEHGRYVFFAAGCISCHTGEQTLAGGRPIVSPFGTFYPPNITPSLEYGIGTWTDQDIVRALRDGMSPQNEHYYPAFPYPSYTRMTRADMQALYAFLMTQPVSTRKNQPHDIPWVIANRSMIEHWKDGRFTPGTYTADPDKSPQWNRGAYIAMALGHCGECHTARGYLGAPRHDRYLAGSCSGAEGLPVPNITQDRQTGIGRWTYPELITFLATGQRPDGSFTGSLMAEVLGTSCMRLTNTDLHALATFLQSVPAIHNNLVRQCTPFDDSMYAE
jgi:mono/diheme cytochrome c family protein